MEISEIQLGKCYRGHSGAWRTVRAFAGNPEGSDLTYYDHHTQQTRQMFTCNFAKWAKEEVVS